jgi:hypothetical protein
MTVFRKEQGHQLRMDSLVAAEVSAKEAAYKVAVYGSVIAWEMYVFDLSEKALEIVSEFFDLGGFSCTVQAFEDY